MKTKRHPKTPFFVIASATLLAASLIIVLSMTQLLAWRDEQTKLLIGKSKAASSAAAREEYLAQAMIVGWGGAAAPQALGDYYLSIGRYDKAWRVLQAWPLKPNYTQLGNYALRAQDYSPAQRFFARAITQKATADAYVGLAAALFNKKDFANGCANAAKANKLDLTSQAAQDVAVACLVLDPKQTALSASDYPDAQSAQLQTERGVGRFLLAQRIYSVGEDRLNASARKTADDWLALALVANARGNYDLTVERAERGVSLDRSNTALNKLLAQTYRILAQDKAKLYEARLESLPKS